MWVLDGLTDNISSSEPDSDSDLGLSCLRATEFLIL
jgi:hypothetical protein